MNSVPKKRCKLCGVDKPGTLEHFLSNGIGKIKNICKLCSRKNPDGGRKKLPLCPDGFKVCTSCLENFLATRQHFALCKTGKYGLAAVCKKCKSKHDAKGWIDDPGRRKNVNAATTRRFAKDPEAVKKGIQEWYQRNRPQELLRLANYRRKNKERIRSYQAKWYQRNREHVARRVKAYRLANPEIWSTARHNRRARLMQAEGSYTKEEWEAKLRQHKSRCHWCLQKIQGSLHKDHVIPLSRGGTNYISNIVPSCAHCNLSKNARLPHEFSGRLF